MMAEFEEPVRELESPGEEHKEYVTIDEIIPFIGEFKRFQWILGLMFCIAVYPNTNQLLIMVFAASDPDWRCVNSSTVCHGNGTYSSRNTSRCNMPRAEWEYTEPKHFSIVTWYDIYCENSSMIELSTSIFFIGSGVGSLFIGYIADNYGRKKVLFSSLAMIMLSGILATFMPNIHLFILLRFIAGFFEPGTSAQMCLILFELVSSRYRPHAGTLIWISFPIALCVLALQAYYISNWQTLFLVCTVPYIVVLLFYKFTPESPRFLRLKGKTDELMHTLQRIARFNDKEIPSNLHILPVDDEAEKQSSNPLHLFRTRKVAFLTLVTGYGMFVHALVYYSIHMAVSELGGSLYLNFLLLSAVEIPATIGSIFICDKLGRKYPTIVCATLTGLSCIVIGCLPAAQETARTIAGLIGKFTITISWNTFGIWNLELFPTITRGQIMGFTCIAVRIGSSVAPWVAIRLAASHPTAPYIFMAVATSVCVILFFLLSETKGRATVETIEDLGTITREVTTEEGESLLTDNDLVT